MSRIPIRIRLTAWFVGVLAIVLVALGSFVVARLRADLTAEVDRSLTSTAATIAQGYREEGAVEFQEATTEAVAAPGSRTLGAQIVDRRGALVRFVGDASLATPIIDPATAASARAGVTFVASFRHGASRIHLRALATPVGVNGRREVLIVADPLQQVDSAVRRTALLLLVGGLTGLVLAGLGAWIVAQRAMRPVARMTTRADAIDIGDLEQRVPVPPAKDELNHLARTFNAMLDRLQSGVAARERLIADASHELRAPLAAMRAELDVSLRHDEITPQERVLLESLREEAARMGRVVDNLLTLARIDDGHLDLLSTPEDLLELARRAVRTHSAAAAAAGVDLDVSGQSVVVACDRDRVDQVVGNLIDNAIRVSPVGGTIRAQVTRDGDAARLSIADEGPGIPSDERERIFERFARIDRARGRGGGAGLGLAISREIVAAHGGRLEVDPTESRGATFVIVLPAVYAEGTGLPGSGRPPGARRPV